MLQLKVMLGDRLLEERLFHGTRVTVGRTPDNDVHLDNPLLSRRHATFVRSGEGWELRDSGSRNGVYVGGRRIDGPQRVRSGDVVLIGKLQLTVLTEEFSEDEDGEVPDAYLAVERAVYPLAKDAFRIGSARDSDLRLGGLLVAPCLAFVVRGRSGYRLVDVSPAGKGVFHNGKPLQGHCRLSDGDRIEVGGRLARFHVKRKETQ